jgi:hypothetical protein
VFQGQGDVTELLEDGGQGEMAAGEKTLTPVVSRPPIDLMGDAAGLGDVAAAPVQVGLDEASGLLGR